MKINAVFEGGGVKAIALVGAIQEAERYGVQFHRMAGTSSGSIVAAFLSAGYNAKEMRELIMGSPFKSFLERSAFQRVKWFGPAARLFIKKGLHSGDRLERWIRDRLAERGVRYFSDLPQKKLRIIASDVSQGKLLVLPDDIAEYGIDPDRLEVAKAVRMSSSLPYFFEPVVLPRIVEKPNLGLTIDKCYILDGALLSNFPLWLFDQPENGKSPKQTYDLTPTIGFQLTGRNVGTPYRIIGPLTLFYALFATMMEAHDERYIEKNNRFRTIKIPTLGVQTTDFDISPEKSQQLFDSGRAAANEFFEKWSYSGYMNQYQKWNGN